MSGRYREQSSQIFLQPIDPKEIRANNPLLVVIEEFVDEHLKLDEFSEKLKNERTGAPAVDPRLMLKILFYAIATGVRSYRKIENHLQWDQNFLVLSMQQNIDHTTICRFINKYEKEIVDFFAVMLYALRSQKYVTLGFIAVDGTKIKASAGKDFSGNIQDFKRRKVKLEQRIKDLLHSISGPDQDPDPGTKKKKEKKLQTLQQRQEKISKFLDQVAHNFESSPAEEEKINLTDLDARQMKDKDSVYMGYNAQLAVDGNHFIVGYDVFNATTDQNHLRPMIEATREQTGDQLTNSIITFDAGFHSSSNIIYSAEQGLNVYLPEGQQPDGSKSTSFSTFTTRDCELLNEQEKPFLVCPGGQKMEGKYAYRPERKVGYYKFRPLKGTCLNCSFFDKCYGSRKSKRFEVGELPFKALPYSLKMKRKVASDEGRQRRTERFATNEHVFGEIKDHMNLRKFHHRGKKKIKTIWCITAISYNFRRLASLRAA